LAEEKFSRLSAEPVAATDDAVYRGGDFRLEEDLEQAHIAYAFPGVASGHPDFAIAQIYTTVLGGGMSSRLFQEVREKRGLCYSIYAFTNNFQDTGFTGIYAGTSEKEAGELSAVIAGEMEAMTAVISDAELSRAKAQLKSSILMGLERPGSRAEQIAGHIFTFGRVLSVAEMVEQIEAVNETQIRHYAARIMTMPTIAAIGPVRKLERHDQFAARFAPGRAAAE
jgi:predicted Zn-dependent peptidase